MEIVESAISSGELDLMNDQAVALALEQCKGAIDTYVKEARSNSISETILAMSNEDPAAVVEALKRVLGERLSGEDLATMSRILS